jgi:hypothetical protein
MKKGEGFQGKVIGHWWLKINRLSFFFRLNSLNFALRASCFVLFFFFIQNIIAQENPYLYHVNQYNFIRYDLNQMIHFDEDRYSSGFNEKLEHLMRTGEGRINIVQIGGSHIQAGTFSGQMRTRLQQMNGEMNAGRGFMFPYRMARTNSPFGYYIRYSGSWETCRNVETRKTCRIGVGGIVANTSSAKAELTVLLEEENVLDYRFNKIRIFYESTGDYTVSIDSSLLKNGVRTDSFYDFELNNHVDSLKITIEKSENGAGTFSLYGLSAESAPNGIMYHSIGINGAKVPSFLRCELFENQLKMLQPDLVILGLGINDAYGKRFSQKLYEENYEMLIQGIRTVAPDAAIILTTNNDSYLYRRYVNRHGEKVEESMLKLSEKMEVGVWNMFDVMGGLNSIVLWQKYGLAQRDKIHFTREGYLLIGDLFFTALMQNFENYLLSKNQITLHKENQKITPETKPQETFLNRNTTQNNIE